MTGPGGMEDTLRDALRGLAPTAPADEAAHAGVRRAITRRRRRRTTGRVAAVVLAVAAVAGGRALVAGLDDAEGPRYSTDDAPGPTAQPGPSAPTTAPATGDTGATQTFGPVTFDVPPGWAATPSGEASLCVAPIDGAGRSWDGCAGLRLYRGELPGYEGGTYVEHGPWGFATSTDPTPCPAPTGSQPAEGDVVVPGQAGTGPVDQGFKPVGERTATYDQWFARCSESGFTFTPRAWLLPQSQVLVVDVFGLPETEAILASFRFTG
jgi:hypothetical protein